MKLNIEALGSDFWQWVENNQALNSAQAAIAARKVMDRTMADLAATQIEARRKLRKGGKLNALLESCSRLIVPTTLLAEQSSAWPVACFNAQAGEVEAGWRVADLTFGLGIDAFALAAQGAQVTGIDINRGAVEAGSYNSRLLGHDMQLIASDALLWLKKEVELNHKYDMLFIDPARRDAAGGRVYSFDICDPDLNQVLHYARSLTKRLMVKASPMLDIDKVMQTYGEIDKLWCVGLKGECKELLLRFNFEASALQRRIISVELDGHDGKYEISDSWPRQKIPLAASALALSAGKWIYMPTAAIVKGRPSATLAQQIAGLQPLDTADTAYLSDKPIHPLPGHSLRIKQIFDSLKSARRHLNGSRGNAAVAGYPLAADALALKVGLNPISDASRFLVGCTLQGQKLLLWCAADI